MKDRFPPQTKMMKDRFLIEKLISDLIKDLPEKFHSSRTDASRRKAINGDARKCKYRRIGSKASCCPPTFQKQWGSRFTATQCEDMKEADDLLGWSLASYTGSPLHQNMINNMSDGAGISRK
ncbi:hypothetical protein ACFE04_017973 [Oxalis oulophora]